MAVSTVRLASTITLPVRSRSSLAILYNLPMTMPLSDYYINRIIFTVVTLMVTILLSLAVKRVTDLVFRKLRSRITDEPLLARTRTIRSLAKNILDIILFFLIGLVILSQWGVNIAPILTG